MATRQPDRSRNRRQPHQRHLPPASISDSAPSWTCSGDHRARALDARRDLALLTTGEVMDRHPRRRLLRQVRVIPSTARPRPARRPPAKAGHVVTLQPGNVNGTERGRHLNGDFSSVPRTIPLAPPVGAWEWESPRTENQCSKLGGESAPVRHQRVSPLVDRGGRRRRPAIRGSRGGSASIRLVARPASQSYKGDSDVLGRPRPPDSPQAGRADCSHDPRS